MDRPAADQTRARELILAHGWNTTCYQILNPGIDWWFSSQGDALVGYVRRMGVRVVAGAPVCAPERLAEVIEEWHADADRARDRVCYFGAESRMLDQLQNREGYSTVVLGAQPVWRPEAFLQAVHNDRSLRYQVNRARNKGVRVEEWPTERADNPALWRILDQWLRTRGLPTMHFLVEPDTLKLLMDRRLFVAIQDEEPVGFVVLTPVPDRHGWLTEQFPRGAHAPNGTVELTLAQAIETVCDNGSEFVTMGIVPLSSHGFEAAAENNPSWLRLIMRWARAHGKRFYNFEGLDAFKSKFAPERWEPIYAISRERRFSLRTLWAIAAAFSDGPPVIAFLRSLGRAARQEVRWLGERLESSQA